jgi:hypothetical protein
MTFAKLFPLLVGAGVLGWLFATRRRPVKK